MFNEKMDMWNPKTSTNSVILDTTKPTLSTVTLSTANSDNPVIPNGIVNGDYALLTSGNCESSGFYNITTNTGSNYGTCQDAASYFTETTWGGDANWDDLPKGCFARTNGQALFNTRSSYSDLSNFWQAGYYLCKVNSSALKHAKSGDNLTLSFISSEFIFTCRNV